MTVFCPADTRALVTQEQISNFALCYQYYLANDADSRGRVKFAHLPTTLRASQELIAPLSERQKRQLEYLAQHYALWCGFYDIDWRLVLGLGAEHVQETNLRLHHVYGIPMIPASAIKGVVRSWVIAEQFDGQEAAALAAEDVAQVFGTPEAAGRVVFLPAYPTSRSVGLAVDIMNPHFPNYYTGTELPTDTQNPIPINFLTVTNASFRFALLSRDQRLLALTQAWLDQTLRERGLGAKTAAGYGAFRSTRNVPRARRPQDNFETPLRQRTPTPHKLSLDDAYTIFTASPQPLAGQLLDPEPIYPYLATFALLATRNDICACEAFDDIQSIPETLIEKDDALVMIASFGSWVWEQLKATLLADRMVRLPRLIYSTPFRRDLKKVPPAELVRVQEELIHVSNQLEASDGDVSAVEVGAYFDYTPDAEHGTLTMLRYVRERR